MKSKEIAMLTQVHVSQKHKIVAVPYSDQVAQFFAAPQATIQGIPYVLVPHKPRESYMLRKFGFDVPPPILTCYDWPHPPSELPFEAQKQTAVLLSTNERAYVLNSYGTGKTRSALWAWDYLNQEGIAGKLLVLAPLSSLNFTWNKEAFAILPHRHVEVLYGSRDTRLKRLKNGADIFVINHDGFKIILEELQERRDIDTLIIDELATYRNPSAKKVKTMRDFAPGKKFVWGMTGSPIPTAVTDVWAQAKIITPHRVPRYFKGFREQVMLQVAPFKWVPKAGAIEKAYEVLQPSIRYSLDDVVELPETIVREQEVELGPLQAKIYKEMAARCYAAIQDKKITAANAGVMLVKLLQISCGSVYTNEGQTITLDAGARYTATLEVIKSADRKVIVFAPYKHVLAGINAALEKEDIDHAVVSGDTSMKDRDEIFNAFQFTDKYHVIAAHPACMSHSLTLTAANIIVWFGPTTNLETFDQANARITRVGQKHKQLVLLLQSTPVEKRMYNLLKDKRKLQDELLNMFKPGE